MLDFFLSDLILHSRIRMIESTIYATALSPGIHERFRRNTIRTRKRG